MQAALKNMKSKFKVPHTLVIITFIIIAAMILTWIVPAGEYLRVEDAITGKKVVDPSSYTNVESSPVNIFMLPFYLVQGLIKRADLIATILLSGGAFHILTKTGAIHASIAKVAKRFSNKQSVFIFILMLVFALITTVKSVNTFIAFAPITVMIALAMGLDSIVGVGIILLGGAVGFSTGTLNVSTTILSQELGGLPLYSGIEYRAFSFIVFFLVTSAYLIRYAKKIQANPELSPMYELDRQREEITGDLDSFGEMNLRRWLVLATLFGTLIVIVYGGLNWKWKIPHNGAAFIWLGVIAGAIMGYSPSTIAQYFVEGAKKMIGAALILGTATAVSAVLSDGSILDPIVYGLNNVLVAMPIFMRSSFMFISNIVINGLITSGSGQAAVVMPIFMPVADMINVTRQTAILAFNFGDGFCNYILPTSTALMGIIGVANIPYDRWMKFMWKLFLIWMVVGSILVTVAQYIKLGPF